MHAFERDTSEILRTPHMAEADRGEGGRQRAEAIEMDAQGSAAANGL